MDKVTELHFPPEHLSVRGGLCHLNKRAVWLLGTFQNVEVLMG